LPAGLAAGVELEAAIAPNGFDGAVPEAVPGFEKIEDEPAAGWPPWLNMLLPGGGPAGVVDGRNEDVLLAAGVDAVATAVSQLGSWHWVCDQRKDKPMLPNRLGAELVGAAPVLAVPNREGFGAPALGAAKAPKDGAGAALVAACPNRPPGLLAAGVEDELPNRFDEPPVPPEPNRPAAGVLAPEVAGVLPKREDPVPPAVVVAPKSVLLALLSLLAGPPKVNPDMVGVGVSFGIYSGERSLCADVGGSWSKLSSGLCLAVRLVVLRKSML
jgi:hypothetical protein